MFVLSESSIRKNRFIHSPKGGSVRILPKLLLGVLVCNFGYGNPTSQAKDVVSSKETQARRDEKERQAGEKVFQEAIAACMKRQGWTYVPVVTSWIAPEQLVTTDARLAKAWGYGISTPIGAEKEFAALAGDPPINPNRKYIESLTDTEKATYSKDLGGPEQRNERPFQFRGCMLAGEKAAAKVSKLFDPIEKRKATKINNRIRKDPDVKAALDAWKTCLANAGFRFSNSRQLIQELEKRLTIVKGNQATIAKTLPALQDFERRVATADWHCRQTVLDPMMEKISERYATK
jgi:hypothetical protein